MTLRDDQIAILEALADGRLEGDELARARLMVRTDPAAAEFMALCTAADGAVRRVMDIPATIELAPPALARRPAAGAAHAASGPRTGRRWVRWALAACLLLTGLGAYLANFVFVASADSMYHAYVAAGFEPAWACKDDEEFIKFSSERTGAPFLVSASPSVRVVGWDNATDLITPATASLFARCDGTPVVVFIDRLADDHEPRLRPFSGMHLFRGQLDETVFYEVSPLDRPTVLPLIHRPGHAPEMVMGEACEEGPFTPRQYPPAGPSGTAVPDTK